jgi:hypothetical protein
MHVCNLSLSTRSGTFSVVAAHGQALRHRAPRQRAAGLGKHACTPKPRLDMEGIEDDKKAHRQSPRKGNEDVDERSVPSATGADAFEPGSRPGVPGSVRTAFLLWIVAVAAGVFETTLVVAEALSGGSISGGSISTAGLVAGVGVRLVVFAAAVYVASRMRLGKNWARLTLAIGLGVIGTLSLAVGPISWLAAGHSVVEFLAHAGAMTLLFASSRLVHTVSVLAALVFMFLPTSNAYFRASRVARRRASDGTVPKRRRP